MYVDHLKMLSIGGGGSTFVCHAPCISYWFHSNFFLNLHFSFHYSVLPLVSACRIRVRIYLSISASIVVLYGKANENGTANACCLIQWPWTWGRTRRNRPEEAAVLAPHPRTAPLGAVGEAGRWSWCFLGDPVGQLAVYAKGATPGLEKCLFIWMPDLFLWTLAFGNALVLFESIQNTDYVEHIW